MPPDRWKWTVAAWAVAVLAVCGRASLSENDHSVYPVFAKAGRDWLAGEDLYRDRQHPYRYSPCVAAALAPLSLLPDWAGGVLWRLLNAGALLAGLAVWVRVVPSTATPPRRA